MRLSPARCRFRDGYAHLPLSRIAHVHAKDCTVPITCRRSGRSARWAIDWRGQLAALARDGYRGAISLETHWKGPNGDKFQGSIICGRNLRSDGSGNAERKTEY